MARGSDYKIKKLEKGPLQRFKNQNLIVKKFGEAGLKVYKAITGKRTTKELRKDLDLEQKNFDEIINYMAESGMVELEPATKEKGERKLEDIPPEEELEPSEETPPLEEEPTEEVKFEGAEELEEVGTDEEEEEIEIEEKPKKKKKEPAEEEITFDEITPVDFETGEEEAPEEETEETEEEDLGFDFGEEKKDEEYSKDIEPIGEGGEEPPEEEPEEEEPLPEEEPEGEEPPEEEPEEEKLPEDEETGEEDFGFEIEEEPEEKPKKKKKKKEEFDEYEGEIEPVGDEGEAIEEEAEDLGFDFEEEPESEEAGAELSPVEKIISDKYGDVGLKVYALIDGQRTAEEIMQDTGLTEPKLVEILDFMDAQGIIKLDYPKASGEEASPFAPAAAPAEMAAPAEETPKKEGFGPMVEGEGHLEEARGVSSPIETPIKAPIDIVKSVQLKAKLMLQFKKNKGSKVLDQIDGKNDIIDISLKLDIPLYEAAEILKFMLMNGLIIMKPMSRTDVRKKYGDDGYAVYKKFGKEGLMLYELIGKELTIRQMADKIMKDRLQIIDMFIFIHKVLGIELPIDRDVLAKQLEV